MEQTKAGRPVAEGGCLPKMHFEHRIRDSSVSFEDDFVSSEYVRIALSIKGLYDQVNLFGGDLHFHFDVSIVSRSPYRSWHAPILDSPSIPTVLLCSKVLRGTTHRLSPPASLDPRLLAIPDSLSFGLVAVPNEQTTEFHSISRR